MFQIHIMYTWSMYVNVHIWLHWHKLLEYAPPIWIEIIIGLYPETEWQRQGDRNKERDKKWHRKIRGETVTKRKDTKRERQIEKKRQTEKQSEEWAIYFCQYLIKTHLDQNSTQYYVKKNIWDKKEQRDRYTKRQKET